MIDILLINPNTTLATTETMVRIAAAAAPNGFRIRGATAARGTPMIVSESQLAESADEVVSIGCRESATVAGMIVGAFGDPGLDSLRREVNVPAVGLCEAAIIEAAAGARRFGIVTTTPDLVTLINAKVVDLGFDNLYTGIRLTAGDPVFLTQNPDRLDAALESAVRESVDLDHAETVVIGGGPLAQAATRLATRVGVPLVEPVPAATRLLVKHLKGAV